MADSFMRELLIKLGVIGGSEARQEIDATAASVEKMGAAGAVAGAASQTSADAQAAALKEVEAALSRGAGAAQIWSDAQGRGAESVNTAYAILRGSVSAAETAIKQAQQAGLIVPQASIKSLDDLKTTLTAATAQLAPHVAAVGGAGKAHGDAKIQTDLWTEALGRTGRTINALSESTNPLVAAIGRFLGPLAAAAVGLVFFNKVAGELKERGVDISTIGDKWGSVMDTLSISLGGTSKTMGGMITEMEKTQAAYTNLDGSQKAYSSGLALMEAAQATTASGLKLFASVASEIPPNLAAMGGGLDNVGVRARVALSEFQDLNTQLNAVRTTNPQLADSFTQQLTAMSSLGVGTEKYNSALAVLKPQITAAAKDSENWATVMKAAAGGSDEAAKGLTRLTAESKLLDVALAAGRALHLSDAEVFKAMGPLVQKVAQDYSTYGTAIRVTNPALAAVADAASKSKAGLDSMSTALKQAALDSDKAGKTYDSLVDSILKAGAASGNYKAAAAAEHAELDSAIAALEKKRATIAGLLPEEESRLRNLLAIHAALTPLTAEEEKHNKAQEDGVKKAHDLSKSYEDLTKAREKDKESIEKHRQEFVAGLDAELKKAVEAGNAQVKALDEQHRAMEISDSEYNQSVNEIFAKEAMAHRAAMEAEDKEREEADRKEKEHQETYEKAAGEIAKSLEKVNETLESAKLKQAEYDAAAETSLAKVRGQWDLTSAKVKEHADEYPKLNIVWGSFENTIRTGSANIITDLDGLIVKLRSVKQAIGEVDVAASQAFGGTGGGAPEQFGPPTPAPEPSGSAPGTEFTT